MAGHVLTPLDGSPIGEAALPFASSIAAGAGWNLHLLNVHVPDPRTRRIAPPRSSSSGPTLLSPGDRALRARRAYLESTVERYGLRVGSLAALEMMKGGIPSTIRNHAEGLETDLIVMGTHGRTGMERLWLGSVADAVARLTHIPVLLVRDPGEPARVRGPSRLRRVLVPLDMSEMAERILPSVLELGALLAWSIHLLYVVPTRILFGARSYPLLAGDVMSRHRRGTEYLRTVASRFRERRLDVDVAVTESEDPTRAIARVAQEREMDLVAMASHGRAGLTRAILGSVSDGVMSASTLPLLLGGGGTMH